MVIKKKIKRKFLISWELTWIHVVIFLVLCLVFIRETRFAFWNSEMDDSTFDMWNVWSTSLAWMLNLVYDSGVWWEENWENFHAAAWGEEDSLTDTTVVWNTRWTKNTEGYTKYDEDNEIISICDPYGTWCITIMDRNLWAITSDITSTWSYGYNYQWWNNHWFISCYENKCTEFTWWDTTSSSTTSTNWYWSWVFYSWTIFYNWGNGTKDWSRPSNPNLWWWIWDVSWNLYWLVWNNPIERRQWPCPDGFHIPSIWEWNKMMNYWISNFTWEWNSVTRIKHWFFYSFYLPSGLWITFQNDFKIPLAGSRNNVRKMESIGNQALFWSSSPFDVEENYPAWYCDYHNCYWYDSSYFFSVVANSFEVRETNREYGLSIRCFKDTSISSNIVNFWIWDEKVWIRNSNKIIALDKLKATWYVVKWWHEGGSNDPFDFDTNISEDLDLYADWECDKHYHEEWGVCVLDSYNIDWLNWDGSLIKTDIVEYWKSPRYSWETPTKPGDECYGYEFRGWSPSIVTAIQDASYSAQYNQYNRYFTIVYKDWEEDVGEDSAGCRDYWVRDYIEKPWYVFEWWYFDKDLTKRVNSSIYITSDIVLYGKRESCPEWYIGVDNDCISEQAWIFYESGVIRVTDGKTTINVKDRNQWAESSSIERKIKKQQIEELGKCEMQMVCVKHCNCSDTDTHTRGCEATPVYEFISNCPDNYFENASNILWCTVTDLNGTDECLNNPYLYEYNQWKEENWCKDSLPGFAEESGIAEEAGTQAKGMKGRGETKGEELETDDMCSEESKLNAINRITWKTFQDYSMWETYINNYESIGDYWTYYYRWNNTWANYAELNVNWEDININEETFMRWFNGWRIKWLEQWRVNIDDVNSPCDASKWEYLPTAGQRQELRDLYYNINRSMDNFEQDLLIPQAWNIYYHDSSMDAKKWFKSSLSLRDFFWQAVIAEEIDVFRTISNKYKPYSSLLWLAINENSQNWDDENIGKGIMDNIYAVDRWQYYGLDNISNNVAAPVRCFIKWNDEFVVKYYIDWEELFNETILSWNCAEQPKISQKEWYTFKWRYTEDWKTYDFSVPVISDIELYARFEQNKSSSSNWWWGGWSSLKKDNCPDWDYSDSYYDWTCGKKKVIEDSSAMPQNDGKGSEDSPTKPQSNKTWHNSADEVVYDTLRFNPHYSDEMNRAYQFAYYYGITTKTNIKDAAMNWELTRIAMAKMLSQYAINVLWIQPDKSRNNQFADVSDKLDIEYDDWVTLAYQLWIMWINMPNNEFRPYNYVTRAEFATALSRLLYHTSDWMFEKTSRYYVPHINKLVYEWILTNTDPAMKELRWYVMLMLMRSAK